MEESGHEGWPERRDALRARLNEVGLAAESIEALVTSSLPALMLGTDPMDSEARPLGGTRIGGCPDLPPGMTWPVRPAYPDGRETAERELESAARMLASAGIAPSWLSPAKGQKLVDKLRRERERMQVRLRKLAKELEEDFKEELAALEADESYSPEEKARYRASIVGTGEDEDLAPPPELAIAVGRQAQAKAEAVLGDFPLAFTAQLDLATLSRAPGFDPAIPREGRLYLFYDLLALPASFDPASRIGFHVAYDQSPVESLVRTELPGRLAAISDIDGALLKAAGVTTRSAVTTLPAGRLAEHGLRLAGRQKDRYDEWLMDEVGWPGEPAADRHQLGGWPRSIQNSMHGTAQLAAHGIDAGTSNAWKGKKAKELLAGARGWRLLFQLGPDSCIGNRLPGGLNFLIREEDLAARRFDKAWVVYEQD